MGLWRLTVEALEDDVLYIDLCPIFTLGILEIAARCNTRRRRGLGKSGNHIMSVALGAMYSDIYYISMWLIMLSENSVGRDQRDRGTVLQPTRHDLACETGTCLWIRE